MHVVGQPKSPPVSVEETENEESQNDDNDDHDNILSIEDNIKDKVEYAQDADEESLSDNTGTVDQQEARSKIDDTLSDDEPGNIDTSNHAKQELGSESDDSDLESTSSEILEHKKVRSKIDEENIIKGRRTRTSTVMPNMDTVDRQTYNVNLFNISANDTQKFEEHKNKMFSNMVNVTQMTASTKGIKLHGERQ